MQHFCTGAPYLCTEITICCTKTIKKYGKSKFFDFFNRSYKQNYAMIVGFVEGDKRITRMVNGKAVQFFILIIMICFIVYCLIGWIITAWQYVLSLLA